MNKVYIYFGPKKGFDFFMSTKVQKSKDLTNFSTLVRDSDKRKKEQYHIVQGSNAELHKQKQLVVKNLIVTSDEYASVREHVILNFDGFISEFDIKNIFLHNPPELILSKVKNIYPDFIIEKYHYPVITSLVFKEFNSKFSDIIIGQDKVKRSILIAIYPLLRKEFKKPIVLLFFGPSGVGKTESAKYLSTLLGGELFRKQLSMYQNNDFMTYLFGGQHFEKSFAKDILERETNVILLDEFDKANSVFHSAFYQLFDEGNFVDNNYKVEIEKSIIICTSNYNSLEEAKKNLGDPMFSRFDACIQFDELSESNIKEIIKLRISQEYELLDDNEKRIIDRDKIEAMFIDHSSSLKNARRVESLVREVISEILLDNLLNKNHFSLS